MPTDFWPSDWLAVLRPDIQQSGGLLMADIPFFPSRHVLQPLFQELPVLIQLLRCLIEIASVSGKSCLFLSDDGGAS